MPEDISKEYCDTEDARCPKCGRICKVWKNDWTMPEDELVHVDCKCGHEFDAELWIYVVSMPMIDAPEREEKYLIQYNGSYAGNYLCWWIEGGHGYSTNVDEAERFTYAEAYEKCNFRDCDGSRKFKFWKESVVLDAVTKCAELWIYVVSPPMMRKGEKANEQQKRTDRLPPRSRHGNALPLLRNF